MTEERSHLEPDDHDQNTASQEDSNKASVAAGGRQSSGEDGKAAGVSQETSMVVASGWSQGDQFTNEDAKNPGPSRESFEVLKDQVRNLVEVHKAEFQHGNRVTGSDATVRRIDGETRRTSSPPDSCTDRVTGDDSRLRGPCMDKVTESNSRPPSRRSFEELAALVREVAQKVKAGQTSEHFEPHEEQRRPQALVVQFRVGSPRFPVSRSLTSTKVSSDLVVRPVSGIASENDEEKDVVSSQSDGAIVSPQSDLTRNETNDQPSSASATASEGGSKIQPSEDSVASPAAAECDYETNVSSENHCD